ncbi:MAG: MbcA/ParS/Xre antitoxin family protein [Gammaproteobacteria bacterium]|nr:MbcA/ParS/Xre antitoxin family protein [Gammaproteobacteria bacterium]
MIRAAQGESGHHGNPASIQNLELSKYGLHGTGTIRIRTDAEELNELTWESQLGDSLHDPVIERHHGLTRAISEWYRVGSAGRSGTSEESRTRLTGSVQFLVKLLDFWKLEPFDAVGLLGFDIADADHVSAALDGREQFRGRDVSDRIAYLFSIRATLRSLFRNLEVENDWLREPHAMLGRQSPLSLLLGGSMEDILLVKEYVDAATGR